MKITSAFNWWFGKIIQEYFGCFFLLFIFNFTSFFSEILLHYFNNIFFLFFMLQETRRKSLKPPILVVPYEESELICFITRDQEDEEY